MRIFLLIVTTLITFSSIGQKVNKDFIEGEIYLKVKQKPFGIVSSTVNLTSELLFLQKFSSEFVLEQASKPFYTTNSENLQKIYRLKLKSPDKADELLNQLIKMPEVAIAEKVRLRQTISTPNDPDTETQWHLNKIKAFEAWDANPGTATIVVAVVDNAIQTNHPDLQANMLAGKDLGDNDNNPNPPNTSFSHGTHVAGIVSAVSNNNLGIASASNNRVKVLPVKATPDGADPRGIYYGYEGIVWAADNGANIISLSWGGIGFSQVEQEVIDYAHDKGIIIVAAAGNEETSIESYPAAYRHVISVASLDNDDKLSSFSNFGTWVDIAAPGRGILSTIPFNSYATFNGTSMATPLVASALGYVWSCFPALTPTQLESVLFHTADNLDTVNPAFKGLLGAGRVNLLKAISCPNLGLVTATITPDGSTYICQGQSVTLNASVVNGNTFQWFKNDILTNITTPNFSATPGANYHVIIKNGNCSIISDKTKVLLNTAFTDTPIVSDKEVTYCADLNLAGGLIATTINCNYGGPTTFVYNGPMVGYDGFDKSGDDPNVNVFSLTGTIIKVKVSITWEKKDQFDKNSCGFTDGGDSPYNDEVSFKLQSPTGKIITLIASGTYSGGATTSGVVTTVFETEASPITQGSLPSSGTFAPAESFNAFLNENPTGIWTLLPEDDNAIDPLCVKGFSVTITTNGPIQPPVISWWSAPNGGNQLANGSEFFPPTNITGEKTFYVQALCEGLCPSPRIPVRLNVLTIPQVYVFPVSSTLTNSPEFKELIQKQTLRFTKNTDNIYQIYDASNLQSEYIPIGDTPPLTSPVTICTTTESYLLIAQDCPTNVITWNNGENGQSLVVTPSSPIGYNAYCHKEWSPCAPISSNNILFVSPSDAVTIMNRVYANSIQTFTGNTITATNFIETPAQTTYKANKSVMLNAGFSVSGNSVFTAKIGGCSD
ncbi:S8 family serine peptidase [Emticicia sp. BO119]|uniref:S8 family serine peptidase n=1 Tax=Emticicia sp. BO119 TaxID=2757768 RepID=UPI0015F01E11|nr:S8 family serine peptidase [Emticicia sp. BO119]MBA4853502.1 S8 family serine peptidase [Emticicia sp. BO119]